MSRTFSSPIKKPVVKESVLKGQSWETVLKEFLQVKKAEGRAIKTLDDFKGRISHFFRKYPDAWMDENKQRDCLLHHLDRGIGPTAYNLDLNGLKIFLDFCIEQGIFDSNVVTQFKKRRTFPRIVDIPIEVLKRLIDLPDQKSYVGYRDHCLILLTLDCGIRPNEALTLLLKDVNLKGREIHVRAENAKTRVARTMPVSEHSIRGLHKLIVSRPNDWDDSNVPLFCNWSGGDFLVTSWRRRLINYGERLGTKISPYDLRHAFALNFLRNGGNVFALQRILGHADLGMTRRYLALTEKDVSGQHEIGSPVNRNSQNSFYHIV